MKASEHLRRGMRTSILWVTYASLRLGRGCKDSGLDSKFPGQTELTLSDSP